jgi:hypothetical protein
MRARALVSSATIDQHAQIGRTAMVRTHQPGEAAFRSILPEDIDWKPFAAFPRSILPEDVNWKPFAAFPRQFG